MTRPRTSHEHGEYGFARREKCHCEPCRTACRRYAKRRQYDATKGVARRVDAGPARAHVQRLLDAGLTYQQIVRGTGDLVSKEQIKNLVRGNAHHDGKTVEWLFPKTAEALLSVTYDKAAEHFAFVSSAGVHRRLRALQWMGYTIPDLAERLGLGFTSLHHYLKQDLVRTTTVDVIANLYDELSMTVGPDERQRWIAYRNDWLPPMAWDEATIDDPDAKPDLGSVVCIVEGCCRSVKKMNLCVPHLRYMKERDALGKAQKFRRHVAALGKLPMQNQERLLADIADLRELGYTPVSAAMRLGRSQSYIEKLWGQVG